VSKYLLPTEGDGAFDEAAAKPFNDFIKAAAAEIQSLRGTVAGFQQAHVQTQAQTARQQIESKAIQSLLSLGHTELFGSADKAPTPEQAANRQRVIQAHIDQGVVLERRGKRAAPTPEFLKAAAYSEFGDQIIQIHQKQQIERLKRQQSRITGGGGANALRGQPDEKASFTDWLKAEPDIDRSWRELTGATG
jgi:hypothetical protein